MLRSSFLHWSKILWQEPHNGKPSSLCSHRTHCVMGGRGGLGSPRDHSGENTGKCFLPSGFGCAFRCRHHLRAGWQRWKGNPLPIAGLILSENKDGTTHLLLEKACNYIDLNEEMMPVRAAEPFSMNPSGSWQLNGTAVFLPVVSDSCCRRKKLQNSPETTKKKELRNFRLSNDLSLHLPLEVFQQSNYALWVVWAHI